MRKSIPILIALLSVAGCFNEEPASEFTTIKTSGGITVSNAPYSESAYNKLSAEGKYAVYNKLLATLHKGEKATDFFDFSNGTENLVVAYQGNPISDTLEKISTPAANYDRIIQRANEKYSTGENELSQLAMPLAYINELPLSSQMFDMWMAYQLTNTILFSPAIELDSTHYVDATTVFNNLFFWMQAGLDMRDIVYQHMNTEENWRRFRSPEDNTREMMEIYLMRFNDEEVPLASTACKNWYLTDGTQGYQLVKTTDINLEPQTLLDTNNIVSCEDFYRELVEHRTFVPAMTKRIVDYMIPDSSDEERSALSKTITDTGPTTFRDIFTSIIFSKYYLVQANKIKRFEETFFNLADRIDWYANDRFYRDLVSTNGAADTGRINTTQMNQRAMAYKLGRKLSVPIDTLSFAYYHGKVRNNLFLDQRTQESPDATWDAGWTAGFINHESLDLISDKEFIDYMFIAVLARQPTASEKDTLVEVLDKDAEFRVRRNVKNTFILLDYFSRLPEVYMHQANL